MTMYKPLTEFKDVKDAVFLAGPCPRTSRPFEDWRPEMIKKLRSAGFKGDTIDPTNPNYDDADPSYYGKQCTWETVGMNVASCVVFWVDRTEEHPALTTNIEFGICSQRFPHAVVVGIPDGSEHCGYIKWVCGEKGIPCFSNMDEVAAEVASRFSKPQQRFFTSDTHFGSERHIEFSRRPFRDAAEMDLAMVSNWNKTVTSNDVVYHLGDFGDTAVINRLNFGKMFLLTGNYERQDSTFRIDDPRVTVTNSMNVTIDGVPVPCVHEPLSSVPPDTFFLYGHIHEKGLVKRNGLNVGADAHRYAPVDIGTIEFYRNAILNHYDENVFTDKVGIYR